jgi:hypothetical protein
MGNSILFRQYPPFTTPVLTDISGTGDPPGPADAGLTENPQ